MIDERVSAFFKTHKRKQRPYISDKDRLIRNQNIIDDFDKGMQHGDLCRKYGLTNSGINYVIARKNDPSYKNTLESRVARNNAIINDFNEGYSASEIATRHKMVASAVHRILRDCLPNEYATRNDEVMAEKVTTVSLRNQMIIEDYESGSSRNDLMKKYGISETALSSVLAPIAEEHRKSRNVLIVQDVMDGMNQLDVAIKYNVSNTHVRRIHKQYTESLNE